MKHINELERSLNDYFGWNKARMNCFVKMLLSLIKVRTVNLAELALGFASSAKMESRYIPLIPQDAIFGFHFCFI